jgi:hypothetical protein
MTGWDGFAKYMGVQGVLVVLLTLAVIGMLIAGLAVPGEVYGLIGIAWGFYFGKNGRSLVETVSTSLNKEG